MKISKAIEEKTVEEAEKERRERFRLIARLITLLNGIVLEIEKEIEEMEKRHEDFQQIPLLGIYLLDGIVLETEKEVFPGVRLIPFPRSLRTGVTKIPCYVSDWASITDISYFFDKTQLIIDSSESSEFNYEQFCQVLSLACNSGIHITAPLLVKKSEDPLRLVPYTGPNKTRFSPSAAKDSCIEEAIRLYKLLGGFPPDVRRKLHIPIDRWIKSHIKHGLVDKTIDPEVPRDAIAIPPTTSDVDKMIDLGIAFEVLYSSRSSQLANRTSEYLAQTPDEQKELKKIFGKIYSWRSNAVHTGKLSAKDVKIGDKSYTPREFIKRAQNLCRESIIKIMEDPCPVKILNLDRGDSKPLLENGKKLRKELRKSKTPIECKVWITEGSQKSRCQFRAVIPRNGINEEGYVKKVWVKYDAKCDAKTVEINEKSYDLMSPYIYDPNRWVQEFELDSGKRLLPHPEIAVKYFQEKPEPCN